MGFVDETFKKWLTQKFGSQADVLGIDVKSGVSDTQYERGSEKMNRFADEANREGFMGGNWTPSEIQAVGWKYMGDKVGGGVQTIPEAVQSNIRRISSELAFGLGSPLDQEFGETFRNMPYKDQQWLTDHVYRTVLPDIMNVVGVRGTANIAGGQYGGATPPSIQLDALASPERAADLADMIGFNFQQDMVIRSRPLGGGDTVSLDVVLSGNPSFEKAMSFASMAADQLDKGVWSSRLMGPPRKGDRLISEKTAPGFYYTPDNKTITFFLNRQPRITSTGKVSKVTESPESLSNRIDLLVQDVLNLAGDKLDLDSSYKLFNSEAIWHGEFNHWNQGGKGEPYQRGLGERGRSDLLERLGDSARSIRETTGQGIQILQSGQAKRLRRRPIRGPSLLTPYQETAQPGGFLMPRR